MPRFRTDPLNDPIVQAWDAHVTGDPAGSARISRETAEFATALQQMVSPVDPDPAFLDDLERRLLGPQDHVGILHQHAFTWTRPVTSPFLSEERHSWFVRHAVPLAIAALLTIVFGGIVAALIVDDDAGQSPPHIPAVADAQSDHRSGQTGSTPASSTAASPSGAGTIASPVDQASPVEGSEHLETVFDAVIEPADLGAPLASAWSVQEFALVHVQPGEGFTTDDPFFTCCPGIAVLQVVEGAASVVTSGAADVYQAHDHSPKRIDARSTVFLEPGDSIVISNVVPTSVTNPANEELVLFRASMFSVDDSAGSFSHPEGYSESGAVGDDTFESLHSHTAEFRIERVVLETNHYLFLQTDGETRVLGVSDQAPLSTRWLPGWIDPQTQDSPGTPRLTFALQRDIAPGAYTVFNPHDVPITLYLMTVLPVSIEGTPATVATPTADLPGNPSPTPQGSTVSRDAPQPREILLDIQLDPAELDASPLSTWDRQEFSQVTIPPGESFTTDHPYFSCCPGIAVFDVREGSASFVVDGPARVYSSAGGDQFLEIDAGTLFAVEHGQTAVFAMESPAVVTNTGTVELIMLGAYGYAFTDIPGANQVPPGYNDDVWVVDFTMEPLDGDAARIVLESISLEPGGYAHLEITDSERIVGINPEWNTMVRLAHGELSAHPDNALASSMFRSLVFSELSPGTYTLFNTGENPATAHFMRLAGEQPVSGSDASETSPTAGTVSPATPLAIDRDGWTRLLNSVVQPGALGLNLHNDWDTAYFGQLNLTKQSGGVVLGCCDGVSLITVLEGEVTIENATTVFSTFTNSADFAPDLASTLRNGETALYRGAITVSAADGSPATILTGGVFSANASGAEAFLERMDIASWFSAAYVPKESGSLISFDIDQIELAPGESAPLAITPNDAILLLVSAAGIDVLAADGTVSAAITTSYDADGLEPGEYQVSNSGSDPVTIFALRIGPDLAPPSS